MARNQSSSPLNRDWRRRCTGDAKALAKGLGSRPLRNRVEFLSAIGRHDNAIASARRAQEIEVLSATINSTAGWFYYIARRYDEALEQLQKALDLEPEFHQVRSGLIAVYCKQQRYEEARLEAIKYLENDPAGSENQRIKCYRPARGTGDIQSAEVEVAEGNGR